MKVRLFACLSLCAAAALCQVKDAAPAAPKTPAPAASAEKPVSRELQAEIQLLLHREADAEAKFRAIYDLLMAPMQQQRNELLQRGCQEGGFASNNGSPGCELDTKTWTVRPAAPQAPIKR